MELELWVVSFLSLVWAVWKLVAKFHVFHFSYVNSIFRPDILFLI